MSLYSDTLSEDLLLFLADEWRTSDPPENVLDYVSSFRYRLYEARAIALRKLGKTQKKMQRLFDRKVQARSFQVGDQVRFATCFE